MLSGSRRHSTTNNAMRKDRQVKDLMLEPETRPKMTPLDDHTLLDDPVKVLFAGVIGDIAADTDITNRTDVLRIIDKGKKHGVIPSHVTYEYHAAILSLSTYNIKINKHNGDGPLLQIPMHEVAAVCYIKDDKQHILAIKFGTLEMCQLAVLYCESKPVAEELCSRVDNCFQTVYLPDSPLLGVSTMIPSSRMGDSDPPPSPGSVKSIGGELLTDYMNKLRKELNAKELERFAQALPDMENRFPEFCECVSQLYGEKRKHLLAGMLPFIPADNLSYFKDFLKRNDISLRENGSVSSSFRANRGNYPGRWSIGEVSTTSSISSVETDPAKYVPNADY